jgi:peptide/nickel transport system ATP-binding protein
LKILDVQSFGVSFDIDDKSSFEAVKNVSFSLAAGEILGLIGESGSGKSVTSQAITRLIDEARCKGQVKFYQQKAETDLLTCDIKTLQAIRRGEISYIFQEPMTALNPLITCGKQILECTTDKSDEHLTSLLHKVELTDTQRMASSYPHELSGGQRQRIMIAMALAKNPKLLIADEPTTALDIAVQTEILQLIKKLSRDEQMAVLFITHDLLSLSGFADNIAVMYHGSMVEINEASHVLSNPQHPYTKALLRSRATYKQRGNSLAEIDHLLEDNEGVLKFVEPETQALSEEEDSSVELLKLRGVEKSHFTHSLFSTQETKVLHDIDITIHQGDIVGLIGESGSGKSTIAKLILKIWEATQGEIYYDDKDIKNISDLSNDIQLVFQDPFSSLNPKHKIGKAISEVLRTIDKRASKEQLRNKVVLLLQEVGLTASDFDKYPHEFSGGQRQRICIAKSLAKNPKIIVLDEAVSALDVSVQAKVLNLLNDLKRKNGLTYLLISHDMNVVSYFCNKIVVLKQGKIVEIGKTERLISAPQSDYTKTLLEHSIK